MRAIQLHPLPEAHHLCPRCQKPLTASGWHIPGMRNLADLRCPECHGEYYGDLAAGQALYTPMLIDKASGMVEDQHDVSWFADWLRDSYANRTSTPIPFEIDERISITRPVVLLNCLDTLYGHSLLKLLNAQYYLERDVDLIVIVPSFLAWMIPEGVAQAWIVGLPLARGAEWNDWLAREIRDRVEAFEAVSLSLALSHPSPADYSIERFTRVRPFPLEEWEDQLKRPTVTFVWRDDRAWQVTDDMSRGGVRKKLSGWVARASDSLIAQRQLVVNLAEALRAEWPELDFAIAGLSKVENDSGIPTWIKDLRSPTMDHERERRWCERYASSHVVVGVHGSNMLLPSAHAGSVVELIGPDRWGNFTQDILIRETYDCRDTLFRYRFLPISSPPQTVALLITSLLEKQPSFGRLMSPQVLQE